MPVAYPPGISAWNSLRTPLLSVLTLQIKNLAEFAAALAHEISICRSACADLLAECFPSPFSGSEKPW